MQFTALLKQFYREVNTGKQANQTQRIFLCPYTRVHLVAAGTVGPRKFRVIFNKQDGKGKHNKGQAPKDSSNCVIGSPLCEDNESHYWSSKLLNPAFQERCRVIGPRYAHQAIQQVDDDPTVPDQQTLPIDSSP